MKKFGFTLAEVLITLGIIGVVAALTTPALVKNSAKAKIGPSLAKFVNSFETATEQMFEKEVMEGYQNVGSDMALLSKYLIMSPIEGPYKYESYTGTYGGMVYPAATAEKEYEDAKKNYDDSNCASSWHDGCQELMSAYINAYHQSQNAEGNTVWQLKDGTIMAVVPVTYNSETSKGAYKGVVAEIFVDIDGNKGENRAGKDVYAFLLDRTGVLIPAGSNAHKFVEQNGKTYSINYETNCALTNDVQANFSCTGKIADNNWKFD